MGSQHYAAATEFYRQTLAPLGLSLLRDTGKEAAFGTPEHWGFFLYPAETSPTAPGLHLAFAASARTEVAAVHAAALAAGGRTSSRRASGLTSAPPTLAPCSRTWTDTASRC